MQNATPAANTTTISFNCIVKGKEKKVEIFLQFAFAVNAQRCADDLLSYFFECYGEEVDFEDLKKSEIKQEVVDFLFEEHLKICKISIV